MNEKFTETQDQSVSRHIGQSKGCSNRKEGISGRIPGRLQVSETQDGQKHIGVQKADKGYRENSGFRSGDFSIKKNFYPAFIFPVIATITAYLWWLFFSIIF